MIVNLNLRNPNRTFKLAQTTIRTFSGFGVTYDSKNDYYVILGINPKANEKEMKKAYYKLA